MAEEKKKSQKKEEKTAISNVEMKEDAPKRIYRSKKDRMIAGVCGGFAQYFNLDPTIVRIIWAISIFAGGVGIIAYLLSWFIVPENPGEEIVVDSNRTHSQNTGLMWGIILIVIGGIFLFRQMDWFEYFPWHFRWHWGPWWFGNFRFNLLFPMLLILIGIIYIIAIFKKGKPLEGVSSTKTTGGQTVAKKLTRSVKDRMISGVCGGIAEYFNIDPSIVRVVWAVLTLAGGGFLGIVAYIVMLIVVPEESTVESTGTGTKSASSKP